MKTDTISINSLSYDITHRAAGPKDFFAIAELYFSTYEGAYPDPIVRDFNCMHEFIGKKENFWFMAECEGRPIASVLISYENESLIAKAFGAVVNPQFRGLGVMEELLATAIKHLNDHYNGVDIIYSTTRTVNVAAQALTEKLGFKKLGIFPNVHKTDEFETHCLAAIITERALQKRNVNYALHYALAPLFHIVQDELSLPELTLVQPELPSKSLVKPDEMEVIAAEQFVLSRFDNLKAENKIIFAFFPFHRPNVVLSNPLQTQEVFCYLSSKDGYSTILGVHLEDETNYCELLHDASKMLRDQGARYIEILVRTDKPKIVSSVMDAGFIPSAFFPAMQLKEGMRYDFVVLSRTFEVLDLNNVQLKGRYQEFWEQYYHYWKMKFIHKGH